MCRACPVFFVRDVIDRYVDTWYILIYTLHISCLETYNYQSYGWSMIATFFFFAWLEGKENVSSMLCQCVEAMALVGAFTMRLHHAICNGAIWFSSWCSFLMGLRSLPSPSRMDEVDISTFPGLLVRSMLFLKLCIAPCDNHCRFIVNLHGFDKLIKASCCFCSCIDNLVYSLS
jgi:hypothetical protein